MTSTLDSSPQNGKLGPSVLDPLSLVFSILLCPVFKALVVHLILVSQPVSLSVEVDSDGVRGNNASPYHIRRKDDFYDLLNVW